MGKAPAYPSTRPAPWAPRVRVLHRPRGRSRRASDQSSVRVSLHKRGRVSPSVSRGHLVVSPRISVCHPHNRFHQYPTTRSSILGRTCSLSFLHYWENGFGFRTSAPPRSITVFRVANNRGKDREMSRTVASIPINHLTQKQHKKLRYIWKVLNTDIFLSYFVSVPLSLISSSAGVC